MNGICERILYASELTDSDELRSDAEAVCEYRLCDEICQPSLR